MRPLEDTPGSDVRKLRRLFQGLGPAPYTLVELESYRAWAGQVRGAALNAIENYSIDPWSRHILERVDVTHFPITWVLAVAHARISQAAAATPQLISEGRSVELPAKKQGLPLTLPPLVELPTRLRDSRTPVPKRHVHSREAIGRHIWQIAKHFQVTLPPRALHKTHIMRHLWASWAASRGHTASHIALGLGHATPATNSPYIHDVELWKEPQSA